MTISSSLNASVAGLFANASRLATISDNIANSATKGYKRAETDFHSMVVSSGRSSYTAGGVRVTNQRLIDQAGSLVSSTNSTDIAVSGRGMIPVTTSSGIAVNNGSNEMLLQTTGSFRPDNEGYLVSQSGLVLMGWPANTDGTIPVFPRNSIDGLEPIQINSNQFTVEPTTEVELAVNLPATGTEAGAPGDIESLAIEYYDNLGKPANLIVEFTPTVPATGSSNEWTMEITDSALGTVVGQYTLTFDDTRGAGGTLLGVADTVGNPYNPATGEISFNVAGGPMTVNLGTLGSPTGLTQLSDSFAPLNVTKNGNPVAALVGVEVDPNGFVRASFDNGINRILYQVPLIDVPNVNGLEALDNQSYRVSPTSGDFFMWDAGDGPTGEIIGFAQEESTTDVAGELTDLIQTQRAYSSNAKVIQTVDEMLQETTNIKR